MDKRASSWRLQEQYEVDGAIRPEVMQYTLPNLCTLVHPFSASVIDRGATNLCQLTGAYPTDPV